MRLSHHFEYYLTFGIHKTEYFCREYILRLKTNTQNGIHKIVITRH